MTPDDVTSCFTRADGRFAFARWDRPLAPIVFGVGDETLPLIKGAVEAIARLAGHEVAETDPELGSNLMFFFFRDWSELTEVPNLDRMIPGLGDLVVRLERENASQYRAFRFDDAGAIQACFAFLRMDAQLSAQPAEVIALHQAVQSILLWSEFAFAERSPLARLPEGGATVLRPEIADLIRAAYDPTIPAASEDPALALRLFARLGRD